MTYNKQSVKFYSERHERQVAKIVGGKVQSNSGATPFKKGDVINTNEEIIYDCKTVIKEKKVILIEKEWLNKIEKERISHRKNYGILVFNFEPDGENYFIINKKTMKHFIEFLKKSED